jgi:CybS, succinate dehydrogenase cytochrome B small subunit
VDYVHKRKFPRLGPLLTWTLRLTSFAVGVGVYQFNTNDIGALSLRTLYRFFFSYFVSTGLTELIRRVWTA